MTQKTFSELNLHDFITKAITDLNFTEPSAVQSEAIPKIMDKEDIIAMAPTGSGKTIAYGIPVLQQIDTDSKEIQAVILCPTRELVIQVHKEFDKLAKFNEDINIVSVYGGQLIEKQFNALKKKPQILIATPGRLMDHLKRKTLNLETIRIAVLDEADEMLDMGFRDDLHTILEQTNGNRQTVLFSATMEKNIMEIAKKFQKLPMIIDVLDNVKNIPNIKQYYYELHEKNKPELIKRLLTLHTLKQSLIFCNTKSNVDNLVEVLKGSGLQTDAIHGDMNQSQREKVMRNFQKGSTKILVATDVAGRGIDVKNLDAVFNYDLPRDDEDYIHRIGRTGRAGNSGTAFSFISGKQINALKRIERANGFKIEKQECPSVEQIEEARLKKCNNSIKDLILNYDLTDFRTKIKALIDEDTTAVDIAAALYKILSKKEQIKVNQSLEFEKITTEVDRDSKSKNSYKRRFRDKRSSRNSMNTIKIFENSKSRSRRKQKAS